jgi:acyl carrier protein
MKKIVLHILNQEYGFNLSDLQSDVSFSSLENLNSNFDSLKRIQFLLDLENALKIEIPANTKINSLSDIESFVESIK